MSADEYYDLDTYDWPGLAEHARKGRAECPVCGKMTPLRKDGSFRVHTIKSGPYDRNENREFCPNDKHKETTTMSTRESEETIRRRIERLERELERIESLPKDEFPNDTVISWNKTFSGVEYTYVAVKAADRWFVTGKNSSQANLTFGRTWDQLINFISAGDESEMPTIYFVTEWSIL